MASCPLFTKVQLLSQGKKEFIIENPIVPDGDSSQKESDDGKVNAGGTRNVLTPSADFHEDRQGRREGSFARGV